MSLTGPAFFGLALVLAVAVVVAAVLLSGRAAQPRWLTLLRRVALVVACQVTAVLLIAVVVNDAFGFYASWSDLTGGSVHAVASGVRPGSTDRTYAAVENRAAAAGRGVIVPFTVVGTRSHLTEPAYAYLPPQYGQPAFRNRRFPVVEMFDGYPGNPQSWLNSLHLAQMLDTEIAAGRAEPFIAILPTQTVASPRDTECVNVAHGPQVETYLAEDVPATARRDFRTQATGWGAYGYSTGGFCAVNVALHHPAQFRAAVSLSGNYTAIEDQQTGELYGHSRRYRDWNSPSWFVRHERPANVAVLGTASLQDPGSVQDLRTLSAGARTPTTVTTIVLRHGGHNPTVWRAEEPLGWDWLSAQLPGPLAGSIRLRDVPQVLPKHYHWQHPAPHPTSLPIVPRTSPNRHRGS